MLDQYVACGYVRGNMGHGSLVTGDHFNKANLAVFEIKVLFCALLGCIHIETVRPEFFLCTPLVYYNDN